MKPLLFLPGGILLLLSGCDAWPTILDNRSHNSIRFHYREHSHEDWSADFGLKKDQARTLAREHWVQDIVGLQIIEAGRRYSFDRAAMAPLRRACSSFLLSRRLKFAPDCYLIYQGSGRVSASYAKPAGIRFPDFGDGS